MPPLPSKHSTVKSAVLVSVQGPDRRVDLDLPADRTIAELVDELLKMLAAGRSADHDAWALGTQGGEPFAPTATLAEVGVYDGSVLELKPAAEWRREEPITAPPEPVADDGLTPSARTRAALPLEMAARERLTAALGAATRRSSRAPETGAPALAPGTPLSPSRLTRYNPPTLVERVRSSWRETDYLNRLDRAIAAPQLKRCVTIAVVSPKGGVGKTTVTALLGMLLAMIRRDRIVAIDTNPDFGSLGRILAPEHQVFVDDLLKFLDSADLTVTELDGRLGRTAHGLMVLPAPTDPARMARIDEAAYTHVVARLQQMVGVVLLDCGTGLQEPAARAALKAADQVVLVSDAEPSTASLVVEAGMLLAEERLPLWLVINKMDAKARLDAAAVERYLPEARGLVIVPSQPLAANRLPAQTFDWRDAPSEWKRRLRELAAALVADWSRLGATAR